MQSSPFNRNGKGGGRQCKLKFGALELREIFWALTGMVWIRCSVVPVAGVQTVLLILTIVALPVWKGMFITATKCINHGTPALDYLKTQLWTQANQNNHEELIFYTTGQKC